MGELVDIKEVPNTKFYCFTVYTQDNGNPMKHPGAQEELELLKEQYSKGVGVFACPGNAVFSDVEVNLGANYPTVKVTDSLNEFHVVKRKKTKTWVNTGMFKQVWKKIDEMGAWKGFEWVIKLDADAVFVPDRLRRTISEQLVSWSGVYIENCAEVNQGFFGNVEVISRDAFQALIDNLDSCGKDIDWASPKATPWGPIGEDLLAQMCMDDHGVDKIQNFELTTDGACPSIKRKWGHAKDKKPFSPDCANIRTPVMHPFKTVDQWFSCYDKTMALER